MKNLIPSFFLLVYGICSLPAIAQTEISGNITENTTWTAGSSYVLTGTLSIRNEATLTIEENVTVNMGRYKIYVGYTTSGTLSANQVAFTGTGNSDGEIMFRDGGDGTIHECTLEHVYIGIEEDAGNDISVTLCTFSDIEFPVIAHPAKLPVWTGNQSPVELIGIEGTLESTLTLEALAWDYALSGTLRVREEAELNIASGVTLDLVGKTIIIGQSSAGYLIADGVNFLSQNSNAESIRVEDGSWIHLNNCELDQVDIDIDESAGMGNTIMACAFDRVEYPITCSINRIPDVQNNTSSSPYIGIWGKVSEDLTVDLKEWNYHVTAPLTVQDDATLTLESGILIDILSRNIYIGSSNNPGFIQANQVTFRSTNTSDRALGFRNGGSGTMNNCRFENVFVEIDDDAGESITISGCTFIYVEWPIIAAPNRIPVISNNQCDQAWIALGGTIEENCTLQPREWPYVLEQNVQVSDESTLTITEGTRIWLNWKSLMIGSSLSNTGHLDAQGALFYDIHPQYGKVNFKPGATGQISNSIFDHCQVSMDDAHPTLENNQFKHCRKAIYLTGDAHPSLSNNDFFNNESVIDHRGNVTLDATDNWWGHASGPTHKDNPDGLGDVVDDNVQYVPFLTAPANGAAVCDMDPPSALHEDMITGEKVSDVLTITNTGDQDLYIPVLETSSSALSVQVPDQLWIEPDSSLTIPYTFIALEPGLVMDTLYLNTNDASEPDQMFILEGEGHVGGLNLNFYHIDISNFPVVKCQFSLMDQANLPYRTLIRDMIGAWEQNEPVTDFELTTRTENSAVSVALVTDRSGSMIGSAIRDARNAAKDFIDLMSPFDEGCAISFSGGARVDQAFTTDKELLKSAYDYMRADGATAVFDAIDLAIEQVKDRDGIRAILVLTDGTDTSSDLSASDVINKARLYGINIYTIGLGNDVEPSLPGIAYQTGGIYYYTPGSEELSLIYRMISGQIQNLYTLTYTADEEGVFPRKVDLRVQLDQHVADAMRFYSFGDSQIDLAGAGTPYRYEEFPIGAKNYFYYYINDADEIIPEGFSADWFTGEEYQTFSCSFEYLGHGVLQVCLDMNNVTETGNYQFVFPDSLDQSGGWLRILNKPEPFDFDVVDRSITQTIDLFAGGSVGASLIAGGAGAGPSAAAAKVSASGHGGMGLTFEQNGSGDEWVARRMEVGVSVGAEAPAVNAGIDVIEAGLSAEVSTTAIVGQKMKFPADHPDPDLMAKAKAAYILETLSIGGMNVSPWFSIVLMAVTESLKVINPDVTEVYRDIFDSWGVAGVLEGSFGVGFGLSAGGGLPEFTIAEAGQSMALKASMDHYVQEDDVEFGMALITEFNGGLLNFEVGGLDLGNLVDYTEGSEISLSSTYNYPDGFKKFDLSYLSYNSASLAIADGYYGETMSFSLPRAVIEDGIERTGTLISDVYQVFEPDGDLPSLSLGVDQLTSAVQEFFSLDSDTLLIPEDHITVGMEESYARGLDIDFKISLEGALGVGAGISFGVNLCYFDEVSAPLSDYQVAHGMILPMYESDGVSRKDKLFDLEDEMDDLINGVIELVKDGIVNLADYYKFIWDLGEDFVNATREGVCKLAGHAYEKGSAVLHVVDPRHFIGLEQPFREPKLRYLYRSDRISHSDRPWSLKTGVPEDTKMYLTSAAFDIAVQDRHGDLDTEFEPMMLTLALDTEVFDDLGFIEADKNQLRIYRYIPDNISWIRVDQDLHDHPDTVATYIDRSATYAIGIEITDERDQTAPEILDYNPKEGYDVAPMTRLWARLYESDLGTGIDLSRTRILLDGNEVTATWDPLNSVVAHRPSAPMSVGDHQFTVETGDYQGNTNSLTVDFTVHSSGVEFQTDHRGFQTRIFPNPFHESVTVEFQSENDHPADVAVYDQAGRRVATLFQGRTAVGSNRLSWNRILDDGGRASAGLYYVRVYQDSHMEVSKMHIY